jgi:hypothetical protein
MGRAPSKAVLLSAAALALAACSSGGGSSPPPPGSDHVVSLSWAPNREAGVNRAGGGYVISIPGQAAINVPWVSGPLAPITKDVTLRSGTYTVTVAAYAALDASGGSNTTQSAPSAITVVVP